MQVRFPTENVSAYFWGADFDAVTCFRVLLLHFDHPKFKQSRPSILMKSQMPNRLSTKLLLRQKIVVLHMCWKIQRYKKSFKTVLQDWQNFSVYKKCTEKQLEKSRGVKTCQYSPYGATAHFLRVSESPTVNWSDRSLEGSYNSNRTWDEESFSFESWRQIQTLRHYWKPQKKLNQWEEVFHWKTVLEREQISFHKLTC